MNILDTLTSAHQHSIIVQFQQHETVKEIIDRLKEDTNITVSEMTIRRWLKARGVKRIFYGDEMRTLKTRQWALIKATKAYKAKIAKEHLTCMINEHSITNTDLIDLITSIDIDKVQKAWIKLIPVKDKEPLPNLI